MEAVTHGRAKVKVDAAVFARKFEESFRLKKHAWSIMSDYANLFAHMYKQRKGLSQIYTSEGAPVSLELIVYAFGELGKPDFSNLVSKVQKLLIEDRTLHDVSQSTKGNLDWRINRIPRQLIDGSDIDETNFTLSTEILNGQYLHLCKFLQALEKAMRHDTYLVTSSPLYQINNQLAEIET